jgi:CRISPR-associated protein Cmr2
MSSTDWRKKLATFLGTAPENLLYDIPEDAVSAVRQHRQTIGLAAHDVPDTTVDSAAMALEMPMSVRNEIVGLKSPFTVKHPLSGAEQSVDLPPNANHAHAVVQHALNALQLQKDGSQTDYLKLWRFLPERLREADTPHARFWTLLPSSRIMRSQSYWEHRAIAAAIAGAGKQPAFFIFTIASAQDFISAARRTQDFWIGSYLLSYLSWAAMRVIVANYGPDALIYPSMRNQPVLDWWLHTKKGLTLPALHADRLSIANAPNIFTAIVPAEDLDALPQACSDAVTTERDAMAAAVAKKFAEYTPGIRWYEKRFNDDNLNSTWQRQIENLLIDNMYWSAYVWNDTPEKARAAFRAVIPPDDRHIEGLEQFFLNGIGAAYPLMSRLASRALETRKNLRDFAQVPEPNHHCSQCGLREALHPQSVKNERQLRQFWEHIQSAAYGRIRSGDRLCAVCVLKRLVVGKGVYFDGHKAPNIEEAFPSTTSIAVAKFKEHLVRAVASGQIMTLADKQEPLSPAQQKLLQDAISSYINHMGTFATKTRFEFTLTTAPLPLARQLANDDKALLGFLQIDGDWLLEESFEPEKITHEYREVQLDDQKRREALSALRRLLRAVRGVRDELQARGILWAIRERPNRYLAILSADGDKMGNWVSGKQLRDHKVTYGMFLDETVPQATWHDTPRFISPAVHYAISTALSNFAVKIVRHVVEERYSGKLVYAGGDDVKALLPVEDVLPVMQELQALYSGTTPAGFVELNNETLMVMGTKATISIGVAIVHHAHPLAHALEQSAAALKSGAKEGQAFAIRHAEGKRNAFALYLFKRSGEALQIGSKWQTDHTKQTVIPIIQKAACAFQTGWLSSKLAYRMLDDARIFTTPELREKAAQAELKRLFDQHAHLPKSDPRRELLDDLKILLRDHYIGWEGVARLLLLARFIGQEGKE